MSLSEHVYARYLSGYSVQDISEDMGISPSRVEFNIIAVGLMFGVVYKDG